MIIQYVCTVILYCRLLLKYKTYREEACVLNTRRISILMLYRNDLIFYVTLDDDGVVLCIFSSVFPNPF